jgi:hypothetical protein
MEEIFEDFLEELKDHYTKGGTPLKNFSKAVEKLNSIAELMGVTFKADPENTTPTTATQEFDSYGDPIDGDDSYS